MAQQIQTLVINNFSGKLVREIHGDLNSGLFPFAALNQGGIFPINNLSYPSQLSFGEAATSIGAGTITAPMVRALNSDFLSFGGVPNPVVYALGSDGKMYQIKVSDATVPTADLDNVLAFTNQTAITAYYGGGLNIFSTSNLMVGHDGGVESFNSLDPTAATSSPIGSGWTVGRPRPIVNFLGNTYVGDVSGLGGNIAEIINGNTVTTHGKLSPGLPANWVVRDLAVSGDGRYLIGIASYVDSGLTLQLNGTASSSGNHQFFSSSDSLVFIWNGTDLGYTSLQFFKGINISSIVSSNTENLLFGKDEEGVGLWDLSGNRVFVIPETSTTTASYPPNPGNTFVVGKKIYFQIQYNKTLYLLCLDREDNSLYCLNSDAFFGAFNQEFIKGIVIIPSPHTTNQSGNDITRAKIYFSESGIPVATQSNNKLYSLHLQNYGGTSYTGDYATQVQVFPRKITLKEIRVFCQPTAANQSFQIKIFDSTGNTISGTATFTYTFSAGTDATKGQGALDLIKFYPRVKDLHEMGIRVHNNGTVTPYINKIEIDYTESEIPKTSG